MNNNNKFVDSCRLLGIYNNKDVYLYSSAKYDRPRLFFISNYFYLPKWVEDHEKLTLLRCNRQSAAAVGARFWSGQERGWLASIRRAG